MDPVDWVPFAAVAFAVALGAAVTFGGRRLGTPLTAALIMLGIAITAGTFVGWSFVLRPTFGRAYALNAIIPSGGEGAPRLFVFHSGPRTSRTKSLRLSVLDARTGAPIHFEVIGSRMTSPRPEKIAPEAQAEGKLWFRDLDRGLHSRDPQTGKLIESQSDLLARYPALATGAQAAEARAPDGTIFRVAPPNFRLELVTWPKPGAAPDPLASSVLLKDGVVVLDSTQGLALRAADPKDPTLLQLQHLVKRRYDYAPDRTLNPSLFLREGFIVGHRVLGHPDSLLIGHREFSPRREKKFALTRVDLDGQVLWELPEGAFGGEPTLLVLRGDTLYGAAGRTLTAVDAARGSVRWQTAF